MSFDVFVPPLAPSTPSGRSVKTRINTAQFGDGYGQRSEDGLNAAPRSLSLQWSSLRLAQSISIEEFFEAHVVKPFLWTMPLEVVQRKWIAAEWSRGYLGGSVVSLSASLTEVFDL